MATLTRRQHAIYEFVVQQVELVGIPPTLMEIAAAFGLSSAAGVADHLKAIERKGYIRRRPGTSRGIELRQNAAVNRPRRAVRVPVVGAVPGTIVDRGEHLYYDAQQLRGEAFALQTRAAVPRFGILANDHLIIDPGAPIVADDLGLGMQADDTILVRTCPKNRSVVPLLGRIDPYRRVTLVGRVVAVVRSRIGGDSEPGT